MGEIKNIIFDLGGVILHIDYLLTEKAFKALGCVYFEEKYSQAKQLPLFDDLEKGKISEKYFIDELKKMLAVDAADTDIINAWNAMLIDLPASRLELLMELKKKYRTFLLSNTNEIHIKGFEKIIYEQHGIHGLEDYFDKVYYSCRVNMRKPDAEIFELVLNENGLKAEETLFIDDSIQHVEGALRVGMQAKLLPKGVDVGVIFD
ncbi:MAG: HAD family hydrolase [Bacteroidia bacterium]